MEASTLIDVAYIAKLAKLELTAEETARFYQKIVIHGQCSVKCGQEK